MTSVATFEFSTNSDISEIEKKLSEFWCNGRTVDIVKIDSISSNKETAYFCILEYIMFEPEEEPKIRLVVEYLLSVSSDNQIFYYRDYSVRNLSKQHGDPVQINVDDLFTQKYRPCMSGDIEYQYLIRGKDSSKDD